MFNIKKSLIFWYSRGKIKIKDFYFARSKNTRLKDKPEEELIYGFLFQQQIINDKLLDSIIELISNDYKYSKNLINLYENKFIKYYQSGLSYNECLDKIFTKIIIKNEKKEKEKFITYDKVVYNNTQLFNEACFFL